MQISRYLSADIAANFNFSGLSVKEFSIGKRKKLMSAKWNVLEK
jgi:hypothetical protein